MIRGIMDRPEVEQDIIEMALDRLKKKLAYRLEQKGRAAWVSTHEIKGLVDEEIDELKDACHKNNILDFEEELLDIAVAAVFGLASIYKLGGSERIDWTEFFKGKQET